MSLHLGVVSIEGDHVNDAPDIFERCDYRLVGSMKAIRTANDLNKELDQVIHDRTKVMKVVYLENGWTHIIDSELVMITEESVWMALSKRGCTISR